MGSQKIVRLIQKNYKRDKEGEIVLDEYGQPVPDGDNWWTITEWNIGVERDAQSAVLIAKKMSRSRNEKEEEQEEQEEEEEVDKTLTLFNPTYDRIRGNQSNLKLIYF